MEGVVPLKLDVTNMQDIATAARECKDVSLLINNAGIIRGAGLLDSTSLDSARDEWETTFIGPLALSQAFAPTLATNGVGQLSTSCLRSVGSACRVPLPTLLRRLRPGH